MAATGAFLIGTVVTAAATSALTPKPKSPNLQIEAPPPPADATPQASAAASAAKKRISGAQGLEGTILTGPQGLGEIGKANAPIKTLLGY